MNELDIFDLEELERNSNCSCQEDEDDDNYFYSLNDD